MKRTLRFFLLVSLLGILALCTAFADSNVTFTRGEQVVLFDQDGVKFTFSGEVTDDGMMIVQLHGVLENKTNMPIQVSYSGTCNGWSFGTSSISGSAATTSANSKAKGFLWFEYDAVSIQHFSDLEEANITFRITNPNTSKELMTIENVHITFADHGQVMMTYFEECPILPDPTFCGGMYCSYHRGMTKINGIASSNASYTYTSNQDLRSAFDTYIQQLKSLGFTVSGSGTTYTISKDGDKLASVSYDKNIIIEVLPGHENLKNTTSNTSATISTNSGYIKKSLGDTLTTNTMQMNLTEKGVTDRLYSYQGTAPSHYFMIDAQSGNRFLYVKGSFKNTSTRQVDIRHIYAQVLIDGQYLYEGNVTALQPDGRDFQNYVSAQASVDCYIYFEIPSQIINNYKSATITLGFTDSFNTKISNTITGYNFDICNDVFEISLTAQSSSTSSTNASASSSGATTSANNSSSTYNPFQLTEAEIAILTEWGCAIPTTIEEYSLIVAAGIIFPSDYALSILYGEIPFPENNTSSTNTSVAQTGTTNTNQANQTTSTPNDRGVIMFQDIPWDSTPAEARKILYQKGYVASQTPEPADYYGYASCMLSDANNPYYELSQYYEKVLYGDTSYYNDNKKKIAGYTVDTLSLCYTYGIKNGKLDKQTRKLISVNIALNASDTEAAMSDLLAKLTKVYGPYDANSYRSYIWYGADGSMLLLYDFASPTLLYSGNNNTALVQQMYAELGYVADTDDIDGL